MRRVLLVDDEVLVRTNLKLMLSDYPEIIVCGEASNGREALELMEEKKPQIVVSDMKMPVMDGLQLCRKLKERYPHTAFVALSNYDDFEYARGTLKNGAADYLLKHEIDEKKLVACLENVKVTPVQEISDISANNLTALRRKFILYLLNGFYTSHEEITANLNMLELRLALENLVPVILSVDHFLQRLDKSDLKKRSLLEFSVVNITEEILQQFPSGTIAHVADGNFCLLFSFPGVHSAQAMEKSVNEAIQKISSGLSAYLNLSASFSIGPVCAPDGLAKSYAAAENALNSKFYKGNHAVIRTRDILKPQTVLSGLEYRLEKELTALSARGRLPEIEAALDALFGDMSEKKVDIPSAHMVFTDLIGVMNHAAKEKGIPLDRVFVHEVKPADLMVKLTTLEEIRDWFRQCFTTLCGLLNQSVTADSEYVRQAVASINQNYCKGISQQSVADEIGISSGYLSTIFKAETGVGFSEYLTNVRITRAKSMIDSGMSNFREVSTSCGFQDYSYFFKVFKKTLGLTPKEYRSKSS